MFNTHTFTLVSGIYTGSIYRDGVLNKVFPGEFHPETQGDVIAIKTHLPRITVRRGGSEQYSRVILVIRQTIDAMKAEFTRRQKGHTGVLKTLDVNSKLNIFD